MPPPLVLASGSPRRVELLSLLGLPFEQLRPDVDEAARAGETVAALVERLAVDKARAGLGQGPGATVVAADTLVSLDGTHAFGKPADGEDARRQLRLLSGREHEVYTGLCVATAARALSQVVVTRVRMRPLSEAELDWYVGTGEPMDKAGSYAIQGRAALFVRSIEGSYTNVVGLPLTELAAMLAEMGVSLPWSA
ncbi:MAG: Maf family protein [Deltaproteobacteria bacterium]